MRTPWILLGLLAACGNSPETPLDGGTRPALDADANDLGALADAGGDPDAGQEADVGEACAPPPADAPGLVRTQAATVRGVAQGGTWAYRGIPYAAPPIGARRFLPPTAPSCEAVIREANDYGPICPQLDSNDQPVGQEDCLSLNVWTPSTPPSAPLPVLFFIHGGGNNQGSSSAGANVGGLYDGQRLAALGNVVVTINYRLGALGFLIHPLLDAELGGNSGNSGLYDQLQALTWVKENIGAFGGDPARVMIFGESAGGLDVCLLYVATQGQGLYARALMESGGCTAPPKSTGVAAATRLLTALGCDQESDPLACARAKTPTELLAAAPPMNTGLSAPEFQPVIDGTLIIEAPLTALTAGHHHDVPLVIGTNQDETYQMLPGPAQINTEAAFQQAARSFLSSNGVPAGRQGAVLAAYPISDFGDDPHPALVALSTDFRWTCATRAYLRALSGSATAPLYRYWFTHRLDPQAAPMGSKAGAYHGLELAYVFGTIAAIPLYRATADDLALSDQLQRYWSRFAATGDPNGGVDPIWPRWELASDPYLELAVPSAPGAGVRAARCDALAAALQ